MQLTTSAPRRILGLIFGVSLAIGAVIPAQAVSTAIPAGTPTGPVVEWGAPADNWQPPTAVEGAVQTAAGTTFGVALQANGRVVGWGAAGSAGTTVPAGMYFVTAVAAGTWAAAALSFDGTITTWGNFAADPSSLGSGNLAVAINHGFVLGLRADRTVAAAGSNWSGELNVPAKLKNVSAIAAGGFVGVHGSACGFGLALRSDGTVAGWGGMAPNLGCGTTFSAPAAPPAGLRDVTAIAAGDDYSLAVTGGKVVSWGNAANPGAQVPSGLTDVVSVAATGSRVSALRSDGSVVSWGGNAQPPAGLLASQLGGGGVALAPTVRLGSAVLQPSVDSIPLGTAEAFSFTARSTGSALSARIYLDASNKATGSILGVYANRQDATGSAPGNLLVTSRIIAGSSDWQRVELPPVDLVAGQTYWIAVLGVKGKLAFRGKPGPVAASGPAQTSRSTTLTELPAVWRTGQSFATGTIGAFVS